MSGRFAVVAQHLPPVAVEDVDPVQIVLRRDRRQVAASQGSDAVEGRHEFRVVQEAFKDKLFDQLGRKEDVRASAVDCLCQRQCLLGQKVRHLVGALPQFDEGGSHEDDADREGDCNDGAGPDIGQQWHGDDATGMRSAMG